MSYVTRKNNFQKICLSFFIVSLVSVCGCTSAEEKRSRCHDEIVTLYNEHIEEASTISSADIMSKCDQAIEQFPDIAIAYELKGMLLWEEDKLKPAWDNYRKALELAPFDEETLANARELAAQLNGTLVNVDENGRVQTIPFKNIPLEEYGQSTEEVRFNLCLIGLGIGEKVKRKVLAGSTTKTYVFVDQNGNEIEDMERMKFGLSFDGNPSASELDSWLLREANVKPKSTLGEVLWRFTAERMSYGRIE